MPVPGVPSTAVALFTGPDGACTRLANDDVYCWYCWGSNNSDRLAQGRMNDIVTGVKLPLLAGAIKVVFGQDHTCAILPNGHLQCAGSNSSGQCGTGWSQNNTSYWDAHDAASSPVRGIVDVDASQNTTCAVRANGDVLCSGASFTTQQMLGDGATAFRNGFLGPRFKSPPAKTSSARVWRPVRFIVGVTTRWASSATAPE
jgi:alpha-tubulin suppressor-like RCC1 family protein